MLRNIKTLLASLRSLNIQVSTFVFRLRRNRYHVKGSNEENIILVSVLFEGIDKLVEGSVATKSAVNATKFDNARFSGSHSVHADIHCEHPLTDNPLVKQFKAENMSNTLPPKLSDQLKQSTTQHLRKALHYAHSGDRQNARLHADLTLHALNELAHHLSPQEYQCFKLEIERDMHLAVSI